MTNAFVTSINHHSLDGVAEIIELLVGEFNRIGFNAISCRTLPENAKDGDLLVIVDEFSEPLVLDGIRMYRTTHPKVTLVCVLTEFFSAGGWTRPPGLNSFKQPWHSLLFDNLLYVYCYLRGYLNLFAGLKMRPPGPVNYLMGILGLFWLGLQKTAKPLTPIKKIRHFHDRAYLWFRALGLQSASGIFDFYLTLHPAIGSEALAAALGTSRAEIHTLLIPPPDVEKSDLVDLELRFGVDVSGSMSFYRRRQVKKAINVLHKLSPGGRFAHHQERGFDDTQEKLLLSFNTPQSRTWRYSSPMRIIGAIKRGQIPVVSHRFGDHPAEDLALLFPSTVIGAKLLVGELFFDKTGYIDSTWEKLRAYKKLVEENNRNIIRLLQEAQSRQENSP